MEYLNYKGNIVSGTKVMYCDDSELTIARVSGDEVIIRTSALVGCDFECNRVSIPAKLFNWDAI